MYNCAECAYINKSVKKWSDNKYCYTFPCEVNTQTCGWVREDKELKNMGCSSFCHKNATPFYKAYMKIQDKHWDSVVLYRLGDFYEVLGKNVEKVAEILDLTITGRDCGLSERVKMCGFPYHVADKYISKLVESGLKVAISEEIKETPIARPEPKKEVKPEQLSLFDLM